MNQNALVVSSVLLASSIGLAGISWAISPVNTVNDGAIINSGTYLNTATGRTTFKNTAGTGIWLKSGGNVRGVEVMPSGAIDGNGGTVYIQAPNQVVRLDGNIDVRGV